MASNNPNSNPFKILPWNGHKSALTLTFDDNNPIHVDFVVPELTKRSLRGTFFVIANRLTRPEKWMAILGSGQEIASHSLDHKHAADLSPSEEFHQVIGAKTRLEEIFGIPIRTFAYPFTEMTPTLRKVVETQHFMARGGNRFDFYMNPEMNPDWSDISSQVALTKMKLPDYQDWINENITRGAWTVLQFHGIEGDVVGWQPLSREVFVPILDYLAGKRKELWVETFERVGAYWQSQKILEKTIPRREGVLTRWAWNKPAFFPDGVVLKAKFENPYPVYQNKIRLTPDASAVFSLNFDAQEFMVENT